MFNDLKHFSKANKISEIKRSLLHASCTAVARSKNYIVPTWIYDESSTKNICILHKNATIYWCKADVIYSSQKIAFSAGYVGAF